MASGESPPPLRLVALDGNGTLLATDGVTVSDYTVGVIARVQALGVPVVLVTGRPFEKAKSMLERTGMKQYVITENGARAVRFEDGKPLYELWLEGQEAAEPVRQVKEKLPGSFFAQLTEDGGLIEERHPWLRADEAFRESAARFFRTPVPDVAEALLKGGGRCAKSYVHVPDSADFDATMAEIRAIVGEGWEVRQIKQLIPGMSNTCEIQSTRVNKADGLAGLCAAVGVPVENVWAFGDDANDVRMLTEMGWGVRMANHLPALSGIGNDVTSRSNDEDGVAAYLEQHFLSGQGSS